MTLLNHQTSKPLIVVIDPGHGGIDPGAVSKGIREKDVVLGVGLKLGKFINESFPDVKVIFTRNTDVFIPLIERSRIANKNKADLFISIHANFCGTPSTRGTETFVLGLHRSNDNLDVAKKENSVILLEDNYATTYEGFDPNSSESYIMFEMAQDIYMDQSLSFADDIQHQFKSRLENSNRGVKQAGFLVLRQSSMPSVLIETGFISNQAEANYLKSEEGQRNIAQSILDAFRKFKTKNSGANTSVIAESKSPHGNKQVAATEVNNNGSSEFKQDTNLNKKPVVNLEKTSVKPENQPIEMTSAKTKENQSVMDESNIKTEKASPIEENTNSTAATLTNSQSKKNTYYSVQIGANTIPMEPVAANFKGLKNVRREKSDKYYRYYIGKEASIENITPVLQQIKAKFSQAFIVYFTDGQRIIVKSDSK
ncbi:MAG: N-acetylmuramoyl-L-alanine amidase [Bacteroidota bacterium]|nr:N-acetylmuramoyl-L-alanine amidase [Bacteroidota bacterium]